MYGIGKVQIAFQLGRYLVRAFCPDLDNGLRTLGITEFTSVVILHDGIDLLLRLCNVFFLLFRNNGIEYGNGDTGTGGIAVSLILYLIENIGGNVGAVDIDASFDDFAEVLLINKEVNLHSHHGGGIFGISGHEAEILRNGTVEDDLTERGADKSGIGFTVDLSRETNLDGGVKSHITLVIRHNGFVFILEYMTGADLIFTNGGEVVGTEHHVLRGNGNGLTVGGLQQVVGGKHKEACLCLRLGGKRNVNSHLVAVEVGVEGGTYQRMQLDGSAFYEDGFECLNTQTVKRGSTVQHNGVILDNGFQSVPNIGGGFIDHFSRILNILGYIKLHKSLHYKGLEKLKSHFLGKTALIDLQFGADNDNGTAGIVNTLTEKVLTETSLLTLEHIGKRLKGTVVGAGHGSAAATVIDQSVNGFLKHSLLVSYDDVGRTELKQLLKAVITVDNTSVKVVQIGGGESAAVELHHGTDIGGDHGNNIQHHPFRAVAGDTESIHYLKSFENTGTLLSVGGDKLFTKLGSQLVNIDLGKQLLDSLGAHLCYERIGIVLFHHIVIFLIGNDGVLFERCVAGIDNDVFCEIKHFIKIAGRNIKHKTHSGGDTLEIPDMGYGAGKLDVPHSFTAHLGAGDLNAAAFAGFALITNSLILTAVAFPVFGGSEDHLAEEAVLFGLKSSVIDGFGLFHLAVGPLADLIGRSETDLDRLKIQPVIVFFCISFNGYSVFTHLLRSSFLIGGNAPLLCAGKAGTSSRLPEEIIFQTINNCRHRSRPA